MKEQIKDGAREAERKLRHAADRATVSLEEQTGRKIGPGPMRVVLWVVAVVVAILGLGWLLG